MQDVPYSRTVWECAARIASSSAGIAPVPRTFDTDRGGRGGPGSTMAGGGGSGRRQRRERPTAAAVDGGGSRRRQWLAAAAAGGGSGRRRHRPEAAAARGGSGSGRRRQRQRLETMVGGGVDGRRGWRRRRRRSTDAAVDGGDRGWRWQKYKPTAAAAAAVAVGDNGSSGQRRRRAASPGSTRLMSGWIPISWDELIWGKRKKVETLKWRLKALLLCFCLFPYFWFPNSTLFRSSTVGPSSVRGEPKIQAMPGSALLQFSYSIEHNRGSKYFWIINIYR